MIDLGEETRDKMGNLYNGITALIDSCELTPPEVITVLRIMSYDVERLFEISVKGA